MDRKQLCTLSIAVLALILCQPVIFAQERIASNEVAANVVEIRNVMVNKDAISGEIVNKSPYPLRNVELLLQYHWLWTNETKPGAISPGRSVYVPVNQEIRPGERATFSYTPDPPLPLRADGRYMPEISLAGFSQVIPQTANVR